MWLALGDVELARATGGIVALTEVPCGAFAHSARWGDNCLHVV